MSTVIETVNLNKVFDTGVQRVHVLKDISVQIDEGRFIMLTGPSGCGKSTLLHCLLGLEKPTSGKVLFDGKDFYNFNDDERTDIRKHNFGVIPQQSNWVKAFNVIENVSLPARLRGDTKKEALEKAERSLNMVKMQQWRYYNPVELSSGQQQKVALARSLVNDAPIIFMDEPTGNLDMKSGDELMGIIKVLVSSGKFTVLMISHELRFKDSVDQTIEMLDGRVV